MMKKGNKAVDFYFVIESFLSNFIQKQVKDTVDFGEGTSPKLALGLGSEK